MKIVSANITRQAIRLKTPFITALRRVDSAEFIVMELKTDNGFSALGSAPATKAITGETLESIEHALKTAIIPAILNRPFILEELLEIVRNIHGGNHSAKAAADMALYSLAAQSKSMSLLHYLGGNSPAEIPTAVTVSLDTPQRMTQQAVSLFHSGYDILKIKVGSTDGEDATRIRSVAAALPGATLLVDANQAWNVAETLTVIDKIADLPIALIEQPVAAHDVDGLKTIKTRSPFPILADETVFTAEDARRILDMGAADLVNIKLMKCGGIAGALEIIEACRTFDIKCMLGSMLEGPVSIAAALNLGAAHQDSFAWFDLDSPLLYDSLPADLPFTVQANRYGL